MPKEKKIGGGYRPIKRGLDFLCASGLLVLLSPLLVGVAIAVRIDSPGPAFFRQRRTGKGGKEFEVFKFRTMVQDNDMNDMTCGNRHTRVGKFLRHSSIDELPQLINVVRGEMSIVGPRPWVPEYYANMNARERQRVAVLPGITGLAQTKGRNSLSVFEKINYDLEYIDHYSLRQDIYVLVHSAKTILLKEAAAASKNGMHNELAALKLANSKRLESTEG